jgi:hypothetical protein
MKKTLLEWVKYWERNKRRFAIKSHVEVIRFDETGMCFNQNMDGLNMFWEWELLQQPIPFMEAVKAYSEGKTIRCELGGETRIYDYKVGYGMTNTQRYAITVGEIFNGTWYAEDRNE